MKQYTIVYHSDLTRLTHVCHAVVFKVTRDTQAKVLLYSLKVI